MEKETKKKRRSVNRTQSRVNLLCVVARMWADVHSGAKKLSDISIKDYNRDNVLGNIGIEDLKKYIMQRECPTFSQMCELRETLSQKVRSQSRAAKALSEFTMQTCKAKSTAATNAENSQTYSQNNISNMTLIEYQNKAMRTCMDTCMNITYMMNGFVGEVGELASKIAKMRRHGILDIDKNRIMLNLEKDEDIAAFIDGMKHELGDCLWFIAGLCATMGWSLENVAQMNIDKLASRQQRGVIEGDGDNR